MVMLGTDWPFKAMVVSPDGLRKKLEHNSVHLSLLFFLFKSSPHHYVVSSRKSRLMPFDWRVPKCLIKSSFHGAQPRRVQHFCSNASMLSSVPKVAITVVLSS